MDHDKNFLIFHVQKIPYDSNLWEKGYREGNFGSVVKYSVWAKHPKMGSLVPLGEEMGWRANCHCAFDRDFVGVLINILELTC